MRKSNYVRCGDNEVICGVPAGSFDADAARGAEHAHDVLGCVPHGGVAGDLRARRRARRRRAGYRGKRVDSRDQLQQSTRRHSLVEPADDRRPLNVAPQARLAGDEKCGRAQDPDEHDTRGRADEEAAERVHEAERGEPKASAHHRAGDAGERLEENGSEHRPDESRERRPRRARAAAEELRRDARSGVRASDEAAERERRDDEPAAHPGERAHSDEAEGDPVDDVRLHCASLADGLDGARLQCAVPGA